LARQKNSLQIRGEYLLAASLMTALRVLPLPLANSAAHAAARALDMLFPS